MLVDKSPRQIREMMAVRQFSSDEEADDREAWVKLSENTQRHFAEGATQLRLV
jgi:hypothetical protein